MHFLMFFYPLQYTAVIEVLSIYTSLLSDVIVKWRHPLLLAESVPLAGDGGGALTRSNHGDRDGQGHTGPEGHTDPGVIPEVKMNMADSANG